MSLQVWLPLNGNLNQVGLSTATASGGVVSSGGKFGQCYAANKSNRLIVTHNIAATTEFTLSFWMKIPSGMNNATTWETAIAYHAIVSSGGSVGSTNISWASYHNLKIYDDSNHQWLWAAPGSQFTYDKWHLWTLTHTSYSSGVECKIYIDGALINTYRNAEQPLKIAPTTIYFGYNITSDSLYFNDIRVYDHCLSVKEVKELAKGLIVHYKLNNLCTVSSLIDKTASYNIYNNNSIPATLTATGDNYLGSPVRRLSMTPTDATISAITSSSNLWSRGVYNWRQTFAANTKYTFWIYYRPISNKDIRVGGTASNIGGWTEIPPKEVGNGWYVVGQYRNGTVTEAKIDNIFVSWNCPSAVVGTPVVIDFACPTLIQGYASIQPDINYSISSTFVDDVSGFRYNGTILNTITTESAPTRYAAAALFNGTNAKIQLPEINFSGLANTYTFSWWQYNTSTSNMPWGFSNGNRLNVYHCNPLCWNTGDGANNPFKDGSTTISPNSLLNAWHHMAVTGDGTTTKLYIDGVYRGSATTYKPLTGTKIFISGWDTGTSYTFNGSKISDFRIYSTTLSQEDIRELYQVSAKIDRRGAFYVRELVE